MPLPRECPTAHLPPPQDNLLEPLDDDQWIAMRDLHAAIGVRYMIGLNLKVRGEGGLNCDV